MSTAQPDAAAAVDILLLAAGLSPSPAETAVIVEMYPEYRKRIDALFALAEARYEAPALIFDPTPVFADWAQ